MPPSGSNRFRFFAAVGLMALSCMTWTFKAHAQSASEIDALKLCGLLAKHVLMTGDEGSATSPTVCARNTISSSTSEGFLHPTRTSKVVSARHFQALRKAANGSPISGTDGFSEAREFKIAGLPVNERDLKSPNFWTEFHQKYGMGAGYFVISHPAVNAAKSKVAFFITYHCAGLCGYSGLGTFEWRHGKWQFGRIQFYRRS